MHFFGIFLYCDGNGYGGPHVFYVVLLINLFVFNHEDIFYNLYVIGVSFLLNNFVSEILFYPLIAFSLQEHQREHTLQYDKGL